MTSVIRRSASLTIDDSFHLEREQRRWSYRTKESDGGSDIGSRRKLMHSSSTRISRSSSRQKQLVRSKSIAGGEACRADAPSTFSSSPSKGKQMLRSVVGFLSRAKSAKHRKPRSFTMTVPASPASSLSRTNSESSASAHEGCHDDDSSSSARGSSHGHGAAASRPRVSFVTDVTVRGLRRICFVWSLLFFEVVVVGVFLVTTKFLPKFLLKKHSKSNRP